MANFEQDYSESEPQSGGNAVAWIGAATSIGLLIGVGVWGFNLAMRDVSGVPVVQRMDGPMRVAPEDPGGSRMTNQGLAVNQVAAEGEAAAPADRLLLAPRPVDLVESDNPQSELSPTLASAQAAVPQGDPVAAALALIEREAEAQPAAPIVPDVVVESEPVTAEPAVQIVPASVPGPSRSPVPRARPNVDLAAYKALAAVSQNANIAPKTTVEATSVSAGTNLVQLGAYDSAEVARAEWERLAGRFESFMDGKQRLVQKAERGGRSFYRLRAVGFADISDARRFCAALTAENAGCIPVVAR